MGQDRQQIPTSASILSSCRFCFQMYPRRTFCKVFTILLPGPVQHRVGCRWELRERLKLPKAGGFTEEAWWPGSFGAVPDSVVNYLNNFLISSFKTTVLCTQAAMTVTLSEVFLCFTQCTDLLPSPFQSRYSGQVPYSLPTPSLSTYHSPHTFVLVHVFTSFHSGNIYWATAMWPILCGVLGKIVMKEMT